MPRPSNTPATATARARPARIFVVGTDTAVGKTAVTAALLHTACMRGLLVLPFKPAQSGSDRPSDAERLLQAAGLSLDELEAACPLRYDAPLAPGLAEDPTPFLTDRQATAPGLAEDPTPFLTDRQTTASPSAIAPAAASASASASSRAPVPARATMPSFDALARAAQALDAWEDRHGPVLTLVEGAGGLHVPMPGGTWQPEWIAALAPWTLVVGRAGLGTINHCMSTIAGLRALGRPPLGFVLSHVDADDDPSVANNAAVIAHASGLPCLGTLPHEREPALVPDMLDALLERLPR